jgi:hypothetical protein
VPRQRAAGQIPRAVVFVLVGVFLLEAAVLSQRETGQGRELGRSGRDRFASIKSYGILSPPSPDARPARESQPMSHPQPPSQDHETSRLGL